MNMCQNMEYIYYESITGSVHVTINALQVCPAWDVMYYK